MQIPQKLIEYVNHNRGSLPPLTDPDELLHLDSYGVIRLVAFLENDLNYRVNDDDIVLENFATLRKVGELLESKSPTAPDTRS